MITVASFANIQQAQDLKLRLGSVGIDAFIPDEISAGLAPHLFMTPVGIRLQVAEDDENRAREVIEAMVKERNSPAGDEPN